LENKPILAIETSGSQCGIAIYFNDDRYFVVNLKEKQSHSEKLFPALDSVLSLAGVSLEDLYAIAVSSGPGSFTGLRIGMSAAKGLAVGSGLPIIPVPTFDALALQISAGKKEGEIFKIANKVNIDEVYYAGFQVKSNNYIFVEKLQIIRAEELERVSGDAVVYGTAVYDEKRFISAPDPVYVAKWGKLFGNDYIRKDYDYLEPDYLKNFIVKERKNA
jgi:tRNA threonylcarbamoyladenosine biosynthesis protein TsaB